MREHVRKSVALPRQSQSGEETAAAAAAAAVVKAQVHAACVQVTRTGDWRRATVEVITDDRTKSRAGENLWFDLSWNKIKVKRVTHQRFILF